MSALTPQELLRVVDHNVGLHLQVDDNVCDRHLPDFGRDVKHKASSQIRPDVGNPIFVAVP